MVKLAHPALVWLIDTENLQMGYYSANLQRLKCRTWRFQFFNGQTF